MRDIDRVTKQLSLALPDATVEQLRVAHPGADDDGLWFVRRPGRSTMVQLESSTGMCPFLVETTASDEREIAPSPEAALAAILKWLGGDGPSEPR